MSSGPATRQRLRRGVPKDQGIEPAADPSENQRAKGTRRGKRAQKSENPATKEDEANTITMPSASTNDAGGRSRRRKNVEAPVVSEVAQNKTQQGVSTRRGERKRGAKTVEKVEDKNQEVAATQGVMKERVDDESQKETGELPKARGRPRKKEVTGHNQVKVENDNDEESVPVSNASKTRGRGKAAPRSRKKPEVKGESEPIKEEEAEQNVPSKRPRRGKQVKKEDNAEKATTSSAEQKAIKQEPNAVEVKMEVKSAKVSVVPRNAGRRGKCVGAHCSISGGLWNAVTDAVAIKAKSFALFLRSQRQWQAKPLDDKVAEMFREACKEHGFPPHLILPHGSYLLNCGSPNPDTLSKSRDTLTDELSRCEKLGLTLYNFHPGSTCGSISIEECLDKIGESINMALAKTSKVIAVIENMSCQGNTIGGRFEELRGIIDRVKDKSRIGVCLDTCHAFAAGYDLSTPSGYNKMMADFERIIGFKYLMGMHLNDSKGEVDCHLDRHENIGKGNIGLAGFRRVMNDPRLDNIPLILETPPEFGYEREIKTLNSLVD